MRWELSEEQSDFRSVLADWLSDRCSPERVRSWLDAADPSVFDAEFVAEGWFAVGSAEELGGQGGGLVELVLTAEELGRRTAPSSGWVGSMLAVPALATSPEVAKALLTDGIPTVLAVPSGRIPGGRPTVRTAGPTSHGTVRHGPARPGPVLAGTVSAVLGAGRAQRFVVPADGDHDVTVFLVDADGPGTRVVPRALTDRSREIADLVLDGATGTPLPVDAAEALRDAGLRAAVLTAADALGAAERMLDMTVSYVGQRRQFGAAIGSFQAVKHAAAEMLVAVESARSIVYLTAASLEAGTPDAPLHAAAAKSQVTAAAAQAADTALTLHGAIGYTWEHDLQLSYKRAKLDRTLFGAPSAWNERLASDLDLVPAAAL